MNRFKEEEKAAKPQVPQADMAEEAPLSDEEKAMVRKFAEQIDLNNSQMVMQYGAGAQKKIADFSETALENVADERPG